MEFIHSLVLSLDVVLLLSNTAWQHATPIVSFTCVGMTMQEVLKTGDRLRTSLRRSETVVSVEGTDSDALHVHIQWDGQQGPGQVRVCQWKVHACGESAWVYISDTS